MNNFVLKLTESKFMKSLQSFSQRISENHTLKAVTVGMQSTMGLIMIGAFFQVLCALGGLVFGWTAGNPIYDALMVPYTMTMGILGLYASFALAKSYAEILGMNGMQAGFISQACFLLVVAPVSAVSTAEGVTFNAINADSLGASGIFVAIIIGLLSVRITQFCIKHHLEIKLPPVIPSGILGAFNAIVPFAVNIVIWFGLGELISFLTNGAYTLSTLITYALSIPLQALVTPFGVIILILLGQIFWFFGIHGTSVMSPILMVPMIQAYMTNAELYNAGQPLVFSPIFIYYAAIGLIGGAGNTLPLVVMGLKSKSEQIRAISKTSLIPGLFGINEPVIFGYPIMYNATLFLPFILNPIIVALIYVLGINIGILQPPHILLMSVVPIGIGDFMQTLSWTNALFPFVMFPLVWMIWRPFYKIYEKQMIEEQEQIEDDEEIDLDNLDLDF